jgi:hypothetical protein
MNKRIKFLACLTALSLPVALSAQAIYLQDDFSTDTSANYTLNSGTNTDVQFAFDYSALTDHDSNAIGSAPNTGDSSTLALYMEVNDDADGTAAATVANAFNNTAIVAADYVMKVDVYQRINGPAPGGGSGSTQSVVIGVNHSATKRISITQDAGTNFPIDTDGYFFAINGDNGSGTTDVFFLEGSAVEDPVAVPGLSWTDDAAAAEVGNRGLGIAPDGLLAFAPNIFPSTEFAYGCPGDHWVTYQFESISGVLTGSIDNGLGGGFVTILTFDDPDDTWSSDKVLLALEDRFSSQSPVGTGFTLFDNLVVEEYIPPNAAGNWAIYN